jgi:hypothetical protein
VRYWAVQGGPGQREPRSARYASDFNHIQALDERCVPIDGSGSVSLLAMIVVTPGVHLAGIRYGQTMQRSDRDSGHFRTAQSFHQSKPADVLVGAVTQPVVIPFAPRVHLNLIQLNHSVPNFNVNKSYVSMTGEGEGKLSSTLDVAHAQSGQTVD